MTHYKIVAKEINGQLESCSVSGKYSTVYKPGEFVEPVIKGTCLFVFDTLEYAKSFLHSNTRSPAKTWVEQEIWSCEVINPRKIDYICENLYEVFFNDFWTTNSLTSRCDIEVPSGTVAVDAVKLLEKLDIPND